MLRKLGLLLLSLFVDLGCSNHTIGWHGGYLPNDFPGHVAEYVYYTEKVTWNEARAVCQGIGGDLAKINSKFVKDLLVHVADTEYPPYFFGSDIYWIGLFEQSAGNEKWASDCSSLTYLSNFADPRKPNKLCFHIKPDSDHVGMRESCDATAQFLCERKSASPCRVEEYTHFETFERLGANLTYAYCKELCEETAFCLGVVYIPPEVCALYYESDTGNLNSTSSVMGGIRIGTKFCMKFLWNSSQVNPVENRARTPAIDCGFVQVSAPIVSTISSTISPTPSKSSSLPCDCLMTSIVESKVITHSVINITIIEAMKIAEELSKNLTVNTKQTSAHHRKLTSAQDQRKTSIVMGTVGIVCLALPFGLIVLCDAKKIVYDLGLLKTHG